jgi:BlaI family penicillinase repressor
VGRVFVVAFLAMCYFSSMKNTDRLSRRERQVMDLLYGHGSCSAADLIGHMSDPPSNSAVRALLRTMGDKGLVKRRRDGPRYLYEPSVPRATASVSALRRLVDSFFDGSPARAAVALLDLSEEADDQELLRLRQRLAELEDAP